jgi:hypothetical protein
MTPQLFEEGPLIAAQRLGHQRVRDALLAREVVVDASHAHS